MPTQGLCSSARQVHEHQPPAGFERTEDIAHRRNGVAEKHHAEARKAEVEFGLERIGLHIGRYEAHVLQPGLPGIAAAFFEEALAAVQAEDRALRADDAGELQRRVAPAAADVEHGGARGKVQRPQRDRAVVAQAVEQDIAKALELRGENIVPEGGELIAPGRNFGHRALLDGCRG